MPMSALSPIDKDAFPPGCKIYFVNDPLTLKVWETFFHCMPGDGASEKQWDEFNFLMDGMRISPIEIEEEDTPPSDLHGFFKCKVKGCREAYKSHGDLNRHVRLQHLEIDLTATPGFVVKSTKVGKNYKCPFAECPSGFLRKHDLIRHLMSKH